MPLFSYDVIFTGGADAIISKFKDFSCRVVFSAEGFCWPDESLAVSVNCTEQAGDYACLCFVDKISKSWPWKEIFELWR